MGVFRTISRMLAVAGLVLAAGSAAAQTKINLGYTAVTDFTAAFVAKEEGFFQKRGLDVTLTLIALNSTIPAALVSDSLQVGGPTPSVMIQAVEGGLDLVAISGASVTSKAATNVGVVARQGVAIGKPADFQGKRVGVPGFGAFLHVLFRQWLADKGVDWRKVTFVEVSFPTMNDVLKSGQVDAVVTADPFMSRIVAAGTGTNVANFIADLPEGRPSIVYASTRAWAEKNKPAVAAFREAIDEAVAFIKANDAKAREDIGRHIKLPPEVLATIQITEQQPKLTEEQLAWWIGVMKGQEMLRGDVKAANLLVP